MTCHNAEVSMHAAYDSIQHEPFYIFVPKMVHTIAYRSALSLARTGRVIISYALQSQAYLATSDAKLRYDGYLSLLPLMSSLAHVGVVEIVDLDFDVVLIDASHDYQWLSLEIAMMLLAAGTAVHPMQGLIQVVAGSCDSLLELNRRLPLEPRL